MAVTAKLYGKLLANMFGGETAGESVVVDFLSDSIKVMLCTSAYVPDQHTHKFKSDVTGESSGPGYTAGGNALASKTMVYASGVETFDAADVVWPSSTVTSRYAVIYDATPAIDSTRPLIGYVDFGEDKSSSNADFKIQWATTGIFAFNVV